MPVEPSDDEEMYFQAREIEQRKALREKLDQQAKELAEKQQIAEGVSTSDLSVADKVKALGFDGDSARIFDLLPLVHVAWADGKIQRGERASILKILKTRGIEPGSEAFQTMESLLEEKPSDDYMNQSLAVLREVTGGISDRSEEIVDLCIKVAASSGGFLGIGQKIGDAEKGQIKEILEKLGPYAAGHFKDGLSQ